MTKRYFITGTDTDAGKTVAAKALLDALNQQQLQTLAMKPVASGCEWQQDRWMNADARVLRAAMSMECDYPLTNPLAFEPAIAPHIAAQLAAIEITSERLQQSLTEVLALQPDALVIEGAGGWELPLSRTYTMPEFVQTSGAEVILVVGMKLGCLNHAVLSARAITADGCKLAGWIAVDTGAEPMPFRQQNIDTLQQRLNAPCLGEIPHTPDWQQRNLSQYLPGVKNILLKNA